MLLSKMNVNKTSRKIHKWLMLFLSIQFLIWSISGVYMVVFDIDYIHGDSLIIDDKSMIEPQQVNYTFSELFNDYPSAKNVELRTFIGTTVYQFTLGSKQGNSSVLLDARNGQQLSPINEATARVVAKYYYRGEEQIADIQLLTDKAPFELSSRHLPVWRIDVDDFSYSTLYISAQTGKVVTRRHQFWRIFDLMFSLHVMDYEDEDPANQLLFWFALFAAFAVITGMVLTYNRVLKGRFSNKKGIRQIDKSQSKSKNNNNRQGV